MSNNGITVTATGAASGPPDRAVLTLGASAVRGEAGTRLGQAIDITETSRQGPGPMPKRAMAMADSAPVEAGSALIEVRLVVRFAQFPDDHTSG